MSTNELIIISIYSIFTAITLTSIGFMLFSSKIRINIEIIGASYMIGLGIVAYSAFMLGLSGMFSKTNILTVILILFVISLFKTKQILINSKKSLMADIKKSLTSFSFWFFIIPIILILGSLYLTSMQPPYTSDELHYHFPDAMNIVNTGKINLDFSGHSFYGNIPKLMNIVFASGISIHSFSFAHLLNYSILIAFLIVVYGISKKWYCQYTSIIAVFMILLFDDFTWNATSGYIDSATVAYELGSLFFLLTWIKNKRNELLIASGSLLGISLAIKYSPIFTVLFISIIFVICLIKRKNYKTIFLFLIPTFIFSGYWYIKNLIIHWNPFYPLYFGHKGYPEIQYESLMNAIQEFGPKTVENFFNLIGRYKTLNGMFVYISFFIPLLIPFLKKRKWPDLILFVYYVSYCLYWFLFATHQIRFLTPAIIIAIILTARVFSTIRLRYYILFSTIFLLISLLLGQKQRILGYKNDLINTKLHLTERQYALGNETKSHFLNRHFGCQYSIIEYLENNKLEGGVMDNWSVWHAPSVSFYSENNKFTTFGVEKGQTEKDAMISLKNSGIKYIYYNTEVKKRHLANTDPIVISSKNQKLSFEENLLKTSKIVYENGDCKLFYINFSSKY